MNTMRYGQPERETDESAVKREDEQTTDRKDGKFQCIRQADGHGQPNGRTDTKKYGQSDRRTDKQPDSTRDGRPDTWKHDQTEEQTIERTNGRRFKFTENSNIFRFVTLQLTGLYADGRTDRRKRRQPD